MKKIILVCISLLSMSSVALFASSADLLAASYQDELSVNEKLYSPTITQTKQKTNAQLIMNQSGASGHGNTTAYISDAGGDTVSCAGDDPMNASGEKATCNGGPNVGEDTYAVGWYTSISSGSPILSSSRIDSID